MDNNLLFLALDTQGIIILSVIALLILVLLGIIISNSQYKARYRRYYKGIDKDINKKYNGIMLIENLVNKYTKDNTNTYKSLKQKGKALTKKYLNYYFTKLPELVLLKSFISSDKNKSELIIYLMDENERLLYQWDKSKKVKGLIKAINKYQMLMPMIAFLYELPLNINESKPYRLVNHDNDNILSYEIVKNTKKFNKKHKKGKTKEKNKKNKKKK